MRDFKRAWERIRQSANLPDIWLHDLRRTAASWPAQAGVPTTAIQKILDHSELAATEVYARMSGDDIANPFAKIGEIMKKIEKKAANYGSGDLVDLDSKRR